MRNGRINHFVVGAVALALLPIGTSAVGQDQWSRFRGPRAGDVSDDPALPDTWSETDNVVWKIDVPGQSWSSPVVWGDHVFITSAISSGEEPTPLPGLYDPGNANGAFRASAEHRWMVYDVDFATGQVNWERELHRVGPPIAKHIKNSFASETPVTDGRHLYVYFGSIGLVSSLNMSGETVWTRQIGAFETTLGFGTAASPALHEGRLYIVNDNTTQSFIAAFDTETGEEIWRVPRAERGQNWATPFIWENELRTEIVTAGSQGVRSYDLDGNLLWEIDGMSALTVPTPFAKHGLVYIASGYPGAPLRPVYAVRPGASGDITLWRDEQGGLSTGFPGPLRSSEHVAWSYPLLGTYNTSALVYGDYSSTPCSTGGSSSATTRGQAKKSTAANVSRSATASPPRPGHTTTRSSC